MRLVLAAVAAALLPSLWWLAGKLHRFAYWGVRCDAAAIARLATDGWQVETVATDDGERLVGLLRAPAAGQQRWILVLPGNAAAVAPAFRPLLDGLAAARGTGALLLPWRGFDASSGEPSPAGLLADARAAWRSLLARGVSPREVEIWGYSLGSGIAVQLAAELCTAGTPPRQLVLLSAYDRIGVMASGWLGRFARDDVYDAIVSAKGITCPVTLVHGEQDDALPIAGARALAAAIGGTARFIALPGRGHVDYLASVPTMAW